VNKIIFQIGALAFFVSLVAFSTERFPLIDTVARAFIVFIIVTVALSLLFAVSVMIVARQPKPQREEPRVTTKASQPAA
jgi:ABC-type transport system involved in cytochrome c biogenesis permease subunit